MNLAPLVAHSKTVEALVEGLIDMDKNDQDAPMKWKLVVLDADRPGDEEEELYAAGSGHPSVREGGRFVLTGDIKPMLLQTHISHANLRRQTRTKTHTNTRTNTYLCIYVCVLTKFRKF